MGKDTSPYVIGDYWLDKRRDGRSPDIWQIARYDPKARSDVYRSTKRRDLDGAIGAIHAHVEKQRAKGFQAVEAASVIPQLILYWEEHGCNVKNSGTVAGSLRHFMAFALQDEIGAMVTVADLNKNVINRFIAWRMGPHSYTLPWRGKDYSHSSAGVKGESVQRNLDDLKAALNTVATMLHIGHIPMGEVSTLLGHQSMKKTTSVYAKYDPKYLSRTAKALSMIWKRIRAAETKWLADHSRTKEGNNPTTVVDRKRAKA